MGPPIGPRNHQSGPPTGPRRNHQSNQKPHHAKPYEKKTNHTEPYKKKPYHTKQHENNPQHDKPYERRPYQGKQPRERRHHENRSRETHQEETHHDNQFRGKPRQNKRNGGRPPQEQVHPTPQTTPYEEGEFQEDLHQSFDGQETPTLEEFSQQTSNQAETYQEQPEGGGSHQMKYRFEKPHQENHSRQNPLQQKPKKGVRFQENTTPPKENSEPWKKTPLSTTSRPPKPALRPSTYRVGKFNRQWSRTRGPLGLPNRGRYGSKGNLCYRRALLQTLLNAPAFVNWIEAHDSLPSATPGEGSERQLDIQNNSVVCSAKHDYCMACALKDLSHAYWAEPSNAHGVTQACDSLDRNIAHFGLNKTFWEHPQGSVPNPLYYDSADPGVQGDPAELLPWLVKTIEATQTNPMSAAQLQALFTMTVKRTRKCQSCPNRVSSHEDLPLQVAPALYPAVEFHKLVEFNFTVLAQNGDVLACDRCNNLDNAKETREIVSAPEVLPIRIERRDAHYELVTGDYVPPSLDEISPEGTDPKSLTDEDWDELIDMARTGDPDENLRLMPSGIPETLNLSKYQMKEEGKDPQLIKYKLAGVVSFDGKGDMEESYGHYIATVLRDEKVYHVNDELVEHANPGRPAERRWEEKDRPLWTQPHWRGAQRFFPTFLLYTRYGSGVQKQQEQGAGKPREKGMRRPRAQGLPEYGAEE